MLGFLAMIRVNLASQPKGKRRRVGRPTLPDIPNVGVLLFILLLVGEFAVLYSWHASASEQATSVSRRLHKAKMELEGAKRLLGEMTEVKGAIRELKRTAVVFDELEGEKRGPVGALSFLSFMLEPRDEATTPTEELKQLEAAGWRTTWDARRAWFTTLREAEGEITLQGEALDHEDVAEVLRRLESSAHFRGVELVFQERRRDQQLGIEFVNFTMRATLIYLIEPYRTAEQRAAAEAAAAESAAAAGAGGAGVGGLPALPSERAAGLQRDARDLQGLPAAASPAEAVTPSADQAGADEAGADQAAPGGAATEEGAP